MHELFLRQNHSLLTYACANYETLWITTVTFYYALWAVLLAGGTIEKHT